MTHSASDSIAYINARQYFSDADSLIARIRSAHQKFVYGIRSETSPKQYLAFCTQLREIVEKVLFPSIIEIEELVSRYQKNEKTGRTQVQDMDLQGPKASMAEAERTAQDYLDKRKAEADEIRELITRAQDALLLQPPQIVPIPPTELEYLVKSQTPDDYTRTQGYVGPVKDRHSLNTGHYQTRAPGTYSTEPSPPQHSNIEEVIAEASQSKGEKSNYIVPIRAPGQKESCLEPATLNSFCDYCFGRYSVSDQPKATATYKTHEGMPW